MNMDVLDGAEGLDVAAVAVAGQELALAHQDVVEPHLGVRDLRHKGRLWHPVEQDARRGRFDASYPDPVLALIIRPLAGGHEEQPAFARERGPALVAPELVAAFAVRREPRLDGARGSAGALGHAERSYPVAR